ncbi:serine/threonine-protein kinase [Prosthecobacter sp.]|uniref:serine/threonine-protein kinase n=1 Tax=Prosthecobacter sp. TaxID=1965333 RepID=UPI002ABB2E0F|nr:serine/threonine-protein kinase [Prosthecobacter sp.]MDZ4404136.1 serine/threonine-protein kinase [Prosthecobacter sp.]
MPASSLISGLDPQALFALSADEASAAAWEPPSLEEVAKLFPQWQARRLLGRGGMGAVYEMRQQELDRLVAVKLLPIEASRDEHQVERFRREARTLAKLRHPGIVSLLEAGISPAGHFFFVMEHVDGSPLSQLIADGKLDAAKAIEIVRQVCEALAFAHAQGVIHRDIKPSNILIDSAGRAKVADFGLARLEQAQAVGALDVSHTGQFMGTPDYAAPEQVRDAAHVDHRADIYSLGVLLYEMLTGDLPRGVFQPPSRKAGSDTRLDDVVRRAMQERPEDRYQAAAELQKDISKSSTSSKAWLFVFILLLGGIGVWLWIQPVPVIQIPAPKPVIEVPKLSVAETPKPVVVNTPTPSLPAPPAPAPKPVSPPVITTSSVQVWSLDNVSPALQPPTELMKQPWQDAVLTASGGAVLYPNGSVSLWHESKPNAVRRADFPAQAIASSGNDILALDREGRLHDLGSSKVITDGLKAVFSSAKPGFAAAMTSADELILLQLDNNTRSVLPKPAGTISQLSVAADGMVWCLLTNGDLQRHDGAAFVAAPQQGIAKAAQFLTGEGFTAIVEENGRCTLWGEKVPDSPQRFRLPAGTKKLVVGPQTRMAAW